MNTISEQDLRAALAAYNAVARDESSTPAEYGAAIGAWSEVYYGSNDPRSGRPWYTLFSLQRSGSYSATRIALRRRPSARKVWADR